MAAKWLPAEGLILKQGASCCEIRPQLGGSISGWSLHGQPLLRGASAASLAGADPYGMASFPLVPYSNRIGNARFNWEGRAVTLARNFLPEPHAIHGVGFKRPWQLVDRSEESVLLQLIHQPDRAWPFAFQARQRITLSAESLSLELSAVNLAEHPAPLGFGHHPYLPYRDARLQFRARQVWLMDDDSLPSVRAKPFGKFDFSESEPVARADIDHCYGDWDGLATVAWFGKEWALVIEASESLRQAVVCIRAEADVFCFEPVPHISNALNRREPELAMPVVAPGAAFDARILFRAVRQG